MCHKVWGHILTPLKDVVDNEDMLSPESCAEGRKTAELKQDH